MLLGKSYGTFDPPTVRQRPGISPIPSPLCERSPRTDRCSVVEQRVQFAGANPCPISLMKQNGMIKIAAAPGKCNVAAGDIVTHINGVELNGSLRTAQSLLHAYRYADIRVFTERIVAPCIRYNVREEDTVSSIALEFQMTVNELRELNPEILPKGENRTLYPGTVLLVALKHEAEVEELAQETVRIVHTVAELSLEDIAAKYGVSVMEIRQWNRAIFPAGEAAILRQGSELIVYTRGDKSDRRCET